MDAGEEDACPSWAIISNNCWGASFYQEHRLRYSTPFVGLWLAANDYIRLLEDFRASMATPLRFKPASRSGYDACPIGIVGDDIEIIFLHYASRDEAKQKWTSRVARLPKRDSALYVKVCDRDGFEEPHLRRFFTLPFRHKICFAKRGRFDARRFPIVEVENEAEPNAPDGSTLWDAAKRHPTFDLQKWLPDPHPSRLRQIALKLGAGPR